MTGGGDCPGLNAFVRAAVKKGVTEFGYEFIGLVDGFRGLCEDGFAKPVELSDVRGILPRGGTILGTTNRHNPFRYAVRHGDRWSEEDRSREALARYGELGLDGMIVAGGDGTMAIAEELTHLGMRVVGCPKTIDNDLSGTDVTFGFDSARAICTEAIDRLHTTAESHERVIVVEVMGRNVGFLALESGLAGGADVILIPEIPYQIEPIVEKIRRRGERGRSFSIVVVAEGAIPLGGDVAVAATAAESPGRGVVRLGGAGKRLADALAANVEAEVRVIVLGHLQRGGGPSALDRLLATRFGARAIDLVAADRWNRVVVVRGNVLTDAPLAGTAAVRTIDPKGELVLLARSLDVCLGTA
jgi:6-phosphofructokinase 1